MEGKSTLLEGGGAFFRSKNQGKGGGMLSWELKVLSQSFK